MGVLVVLLVVAAVVILVVVLLVAVVVTVLLVVNNSSTKKTPQKPNLKKKSQNQKNVQTVVPSEVTKPKTNTTQKQSKLCPKKKLIGACSTFRSNKNQNKTKHKNRVN